MNKGRRGFIARTLSGIAAALEHDASASAFAGKPGLLQSLDPRAKLFGTLLLIFGAVHAPNLTGIFFYSCIGLVLAALSGICWRLLAVRVWIGVLCFTGTIAVPALFLTPGKPLAHLPLVGWPVTAQGLVTASRLVLRAETAATLAFLLVLATPWPDLLKALRSLRAPAVLVLILGMTYRYLFLLLHAANDLFEARDSRIVAPIKVGDARRLSASGAAVLLDRALFLSGEVYLAMESRGFRGEAHTLHEFRMRARDWAALAFSAAAAGTAFLPGIP